MKRIRAQYNDIVRRQIIIASNMDVKLKEIRTNLKSKKVEETLEKLALLDKSVKDERKEMMKMVEIGLEQFSVSPRPLSFGFGTKGFGARA